MTAKKTQLTIRTDVDALCERYPDELERRLIPSRVSDKFWHGQAHGIKSQSQANGILCRWSTRLEAALKETIEKHSFHYWIYVVRRIPLPTHYPGPPAFDSSLRRLVPTRLPLDPITCLNLVEITDAAIMKYSLSEVHECGNWTSPDAKGGKSFRFALSRAALTEAFEVERLAYETWLCEALKRSVVKGAELVIKKGFFRAVRTPELHSLIQSYDSRLEKGSLTSLTGVPLASRFTGTIELLLPRVDVFRKARFNELMNFLSVPWTLPPQTPPRYMWSSFDTLEFYKNHRPFEQAFYDEYGVKMACVIGVISTLSEQAVAQWKEHPESLYRDWFCGYAWLPDRASLREVVVSRFEKTILRISGQRGAPQHEIESAIEFLCCRAGDIGESVTMDRRIRLPNIVEFDSGILLDFSRLAETLTSLTYDLELDNEKYKGDIFEKLVRGSIPEIPHGELTAADGTHEQIDASFRIGNILVIVECKAIKYLHGVFSGDQKAQERSNQRVDQFLFGEVRPDDGTFRKRGVDQKAKWLAEHPVIHQVLDIRAFKAILPVAVTPYPLFIRSLNSRYWIIPGTPRVLTPIEFFEFLDSAHESEIMQRCRSLVPIAQFD